MSEPNGPSPPAEGGTPPNALNPNNGFQGNRKKNNRNRHGRQITRSSRFEGKCESLKKYVYDITIAGINTDLFTTTTKGIAEYIATEYDDAGEYRTGLVDMDLPEIKEPTSVEPTDVLAFEVWKLDMRDYRDKSKKRHKNDAKAFALILGQCSRTVRDRIEASSAWDTINEKSDVIGLLTLIRQSLFTGATTRKKGHSLTDALIALYTFQQGSRMSNSEYLEKFKGLVEVVEHFGGELGQSPSRIQEFTEVIPGLDENQEYELAKEKAKEDHLATLLITRSDPKRYGQLIADMENDHTRGIDGYPNTMTSAYDMLVNYKTMTVPRFQQQDSGMAFYNGGDNGNYNGGRGRGNERTTGGRGRGRGYGAGRGGYNGRGMSHAVQSHGNERYPMAGQDDKDDVGHTNFIEAEDNDNNNSVNIYHAYSHSITNRHLPKNWLLLDSCSSVDLISNPNLLRNIHQSNGTMNVHCNAGTIPITKQGTLGTYPYPVWYNQGGIANIMSLFNVTQNYRVTMDTEIENCFMLHKRDGTNMKFYPCSKGLYKYVMQDDETIQNVWAMVVTVKDKADKYTKRAYKQAMQARKMQRIIMNPGMREMMDTNIEHLKDCTVTKGDVLAAEDILGPNLGGLKGKTVQRPNIHVKSGTDPVPHDILKIHRDITLAIDIMYINKIPFFVTTSRNLHFGTAEVLPDRQTSTIISRLNNVVKLYKHRGFNVVDIMADPEFEPIRGQFPMLNCCATDEHVPEIERYIRTIKDRARSTYTILPFRRIPRLVIIHLVKNSVFWLNSFPHRDGVSSKHSPRYIMTGKELSYNRHVQIEFGSYAQTHEVHDNSMTDRTVGAICLGPTGNQQGGHFFMNLHTGAKIIRYKWTPMPMPTEVITRVNQMGTQQKMPTTLTFADRTGNEIANTLEELIDEYDEEDDASYSSSAESDDDESLDADDDDDVAPIPMDQVADPHDYSDDDGNNSDSSDSNNSDSDYSSDSDSDDDGDDDPDRNIEVADCDESITSTQREPETTDVSTPLRAPTPDNHDDDPKSTIVNNESTGVEREITGVNESDDEKEIETLEDVFRQAEEVGQTAARDPTDDIPRPKRTRKSTKNEMYEYANVVTAVFEDMSPATVFNMLMTKNPLEMYSYVTAQMSAKKGLKMFGDSGADAIMKELQQLVYRKVMEGRKANTLTPEDKKAALKYLMFLKQKRCGKIKGRGCADGRKQRIYKTKEETSSPTMSLESLFLTCIIDAMEDRQVMTCDIPGAFMQTDVDEVIHIKLEEELADLLTKVEPTYKRYTAYERGKKVIYAELNKALYGTVQAAYLFWKELSKFLTDELGFTVNPYDWCVVNKLINGKQCTIGWYVDDLKISHVDASVNEDIFNKLQTRFGKEAPLTVHRGKVHEYLGMKIDYSKKGKVSFCMKGFIDEILKECPENLMKGVSATPAGAHLFETSEDREKLSNKDSINYHHLVAKLLYLCKRARPDLQLAVSFLTTRVQSPDQDDYKKLGRCLRYLRDTADLKLTLESNSSGAIKWWVDASFGVHPDCRSHTGATMSLGAGSVYSSSTKQKINGRSSTEAELIGINDALTMILWVRHFLDAQGFTVRDNVILQDNQSTILLANNGRRSSSKKTRHIEIRYFFITDNIQRKKARVAYCPTNDMVADFFTKPLQRIQFRKLRAKIMNIPIDDNKQHLPDGQECVGTSNIKETSTRSTDRPGILKNIPGNNIMKNNPSGRVTFADVVKRGRRLITPQFNDNVMRRIM